VRFDGFVGPTYQARSLNFNSERCVNLLPEIDQSGQGKSKIAYYHTPGLQLYVTLAATEMRCLWSGENRVLAVGGNLYGEIFDNLGVPYFTPLGFVDYDLQPAYIYHNGNQPLIVSAGKVYYNNGAGPVYQLDAVSAAFLDGYFLALEPNSNRIRLSALLDGTSWPALDFQDQTTTSDRSVAIQAFDKHLWIFGRRNTHIWYNSGNADFPFQPIQGASIGQGALQHTIVELDNSLFFVGEDDRGGSAVWRTRGFEIERVSTHAIEKKIANPLATQFQSWGYEEEGHKCYVLTEYSGTYTFVFDVTTNLWHERAYWYNGAYEPHLGRCHCYATSGFAGGGMHLIGARNGGNVYTQSMNLYTDAGEPIRRWRSAPHLSDENKRTTHHSFALDTDVPTTKVTLAWSKDDGATFTTARAPSITPALVDDRKCPTWLRLGQSRDRVYGVAIYDHAGPVCVTDAYLELSKGTGA